MGSLQGVLLACCSLLPKRMKYRQSLVELEHTTAVLPRAVGCSGGGPDEGAGDLEDDGGGPNEGAGVLEDDRRGADEGAGDLEDDEGGPDEGAGVLEDGRRGAYEGAGDLKDDRRAI